MTHRDPRAYIYPLALVFGVGIVMQLALPALNVPSYLIPTPTDVWSAFQGARVAVLANTLVTLKESLLGCAIGCVAGFAIGLAIAENNGVRYGFLPIVVGSNAVPVVAVAPLIVLWLGHGLWAKAVVAAFLSFFPITANVHTGLSKFSPIYTDLFRSLGANRFEFLIKFKLVNALPFIFAGLRVSATYAAVGAVVAEFVSPDSGIGFGMLQATYNLDTPRLFVYIIIACLLGLAMYSLAWLAERIVIYW